MTMEAKHTPGPWKLLKVGDNGRLCPADRGNQSILTIEDEDGTSFATVYEEADAHLIAAAPDLLEALREATRALEGLASGQGVLKPIEQTIVLANAAIARTESA